MLGANGVQIGTAFLNTPESAVAAPHKAALISDRATSLSAAFSGRPARGITNRYMTKMAGADLPNFPLINPMTAPLSAASATEVTGEFISL